MNNKFKHLSILYVDDCSESLRHAYEILNLIFAKVFIANDGCEAIESIKIYHPDIIISDYKMPCVNGDDVISYANKQIQKTICILITAYPAIDNLMISINDINVDAYFVKPINFNKIFTKIATLLKDTHHISAFNNTLSPQEQNIFIDTVKGLKPRDIAKKRNLNVKTISTYKYRVLDKLSLKNDTELIHYAIKNQLI